MKNPCTPQEWDKLNPEEQKAGIALLEGKQCTVIPSKEDSLYYPAMKKWKGTIHKAQNECITVIDKEGKEFEMSVDSVFIAD